MARPRQFTESEALDGAMAAFWRRGYAATSVQDLVAATGLNRGSLYGAFGDKHRLFLRALDRYAATVVAGWLAVLAAPGPAPAAIGRFFAILVEYAAGDAARRGCFMTNSAVELAAHDAEVAERVRASLAAIEDALAAALKRAAKEGELAADRDLRAAARGLACTVQGILALARTGPDRAALRQVADQALAAAGISPTCN